MAGDWLKMDTDLPEKPEVWQIAGLLKIDPDAVVGKLFKVWRWFDKHTESGNAANVTYPLLDSLVGVTGFAEAMVFAGWLEQRGRDLCLPNFDRHNGKTAKDRALTAKRVAKIRNAPIVTPPLAREEKRREEEKKEQTVAEIPLRDGSAFSVTASLVGEWGAAYPRLDVLAEIAKARAWCVANPDKRKTRTGAAKFLNGWLNRASGDLPAPSAADQPGGGRRRLA